MLPWNVFCCPQCRGAMTSASSEYRCVACGREYPVVCGIPDFRLAEDPYISFDDEYKKARLLEEQAGGMSFEKLVRFYWEITPDVARPAAERYILYALNGEARGNAFLEELDDYAGGRCTGQAALEIGCGTGGFLLAAHPRFRALLGADIALRWLVIAKKRLADIGSPVILVCCSAEHLPFPHGLFDCVTGIHILEHTKNQQAVLSETARTLKPNGVCFLSTPNRFSLGPEPCIRVWGVGFVPRSLAEAYVGLIKGIPYKHIRLLSFFELRRLLGRSGLREWLISAPRIADCEQKLVSKYARALIVVYHMLRRIPLCSFALRLVGPYLQVTGRK